MAEDGDDSEALDRAAILARRQRFIALALTGLAAACGDDASTTTTGMQPCLGATSQTETSTASGPGEGDTTASGTSGTSGMPMPCLDVAPPDTSSSDSTGAVDSTTSTGTDTGETTGTGDEGESGTGVTTGDPMPCLTPPP